MLPVLRTESAQADLSEILAYLEDRNSAAADRLADLVDKRCERLAQFPGMGRLREELAPGLRSVVIEEYVLFYRPSETHIEVIRILHGARDFENIF